MVLVYYSLKVVIHILPQTYPYLTQQTSRGGQVGNQCYLRIFLLPACKCNMFPDVSQLTCQTQTEQKNIGV